MGYWKSTGHEATFWVDSLNQVYIISGFLGSMFQPLFVFSLWGVVGSGGAGWLRIPKKYIWQAIILAWSMYPNDSLRVPTKIHFKNPVSTDISFLYISSTLSNNLEFSQRKAHYLALYAMHKSRWRPENRPLFSRFSGERCKCEAGRGSATYARRGTITTPDYWFLVLRQIKIGFWTTFSAFNKSWTDIHVNFTCVWKVFHVFCIWILCSEIQKTTEDKRVKKQSFHSLRFSKWYYEKLHVDHYWGSNVK